MVCLKCGKETDGESVFCPDCRQIMECYPVKTDMVVQLPKRPPIPEERKMPRKKQHPEEREQYLQIMIRWLLATVGALTVLVCILAGLLLNALWETPQKPNIGQNYTFVDPTSK